MGKRTSKAPERLEYDAPEPKKTKKTTKKSAKSKKDPKAPKRPLSAFMFFSNENRERVKEENPGCSFGDVGKFLGEEWRGLSSSEKKDYEQLNSKDKARYTK